MSSLSNMFDKPTPVEKAPGGLHSGTGKTAQAEVRRHRGSCVFLEAVVECQKKKKEMRT